MTKITENHIEELAIELLEKLGYTYIHAPTIAPDGDSPERTSYEDVILTQRLKAAIAKLNPNVPYEAQKKTLKEVQRINTPELLSNNESFHRLLTEGVKVT